MTASINYTFPHHRAPPPAVHPVRWLGWAAEDFAVMRPFWSLDLPLTPEIWDEARNEGYQYCIGYVGPTPAGCGAVWRYSAAAWEVAAIQTLPLYRRQGVAKSVVSFITGYILANGRQATLSTAVENLPMQKVAEAVGFIQR